MSTFDHESEDQSEACNQLIRDFKLDEIPSIPRPTAVDASLLAAMAERQEFQKRRDAYRKPDAKRHLQDELYKSIYGALSQIQQNFMPPAFTFKPGAIAQGNLASANKQCIEPLRYTVDPLEHAVRSLHAMVLQEVDLYLEEHDAAIRHDIQAVSEKMRENPPTDKGEVSDGYHTFNELYDHRITLWIALCKRLVDEKEIGYAWRSTHHSDGTTFEGWFVLGLGYRQGQQMTYHVPLSRWDETSFAQTLAKAPNFDGHSAADVLKRIKSL